MLRKLTETDCRTAMREGDFAESLRKSSATLVLCLTQSWCPQWTMMRQLLEEASAREGVACYYVEYDLEPFFDEFRAFKEAVLGNDQVPYLRYYRDGELRRTSNFLDKGSFRKLLEG